MLFIEPKAPFAGRSEKVCDPKINQVLYNIEGKSSICLWHVTISTLMKLENILPADDKEKARLIW